jgi:hypothetical protein
MSETVGFTGSRELSLPLAQSRRVIREAVQSLPKDARVVTGACIGVDAEVAYLAYGTHHVHTIVPADRSRVDPHWRDYCDTFEEMPPGTTYRDRNERIVEVSTRLIGIAQAPENDIHSRRSGTWQTIRLARKAGRSVEVRLLTTTCDS